MEWTITSHGEKFVSHRNTSIFLSFSLSRVSNENSSGTKIYRFQDTSVITYDMTFVINREIKFLISKKVQTEIDWITCFYQPNPKTLGKVEVNTITRYWFWVSREIFRKISYTRDRGRDQENYRCSCLIDSLPFNLYYPASLENARVHCIMGRICFPYYIRFYTITRPYFIDDTFYGAHFIAHDIEITFHFT